MTGRRRGSASDSTYKLPEQDGGTRVVGFPGVAQFGSVSDLGSEGRGFKSRRPDLRRIVVSLRNTSCTLEKLVSGGCYDFPTTTVDKQDAADIKG